MPETYLTARKMSRARARPTKWSADKGELISRSTQCGVVHAPCVPRNRGPPGEFSGAAGSVRREPSRAERSLPCCVAGLTHCGHHGAGRLRAERCPAPDMPAGLIGAGIAWCVA
ncbi:unnamed protein product [Lepidochelys kempii]